MVSESFFKQRRRILQFGSAAIGITALVGHPRAQGGFVGRSPKTVSVRGTGAKGDGATDDTAAIQRALDDLGAAGGVVLIEPGIYMIDAGTSLRMRSRSSLHLSEGAVLRCISNSLAHYAIITVEGVEDVRVSGGRIEGDRSSHGATDGEWGHGIAVLGSHSVTIERCQVSDCWGDGLYVGPSGGPSGKPSAGITIDSVKCHENRRQGLSVTAASRVVIRNSAFTKTGGTAPACGIDIEPGKTASASDIKVENCDCSGNEGSGITVDGDVSQFVLKCTSLSHNDGYGLLVTSATGVSIVGNEFTANGLSGIKVRHRAQKGTIEWNTFDGNEWSSSRRVMRALSGGGGPGGSSDIDVDDDSRAVKVGTNTFKH